MIYIVKIIDLMHTKKKLIFRQIQVLMLQQLTQK